MKDAREILACHIKPGDTLPNVGVVARVMRHDHVTNVFMSALFTVSEWVVSYPNRMTVYVVREE